MKRYILSVAIVLVAFGASAQNTNQNVALSVSQAQVAVDEASRNYEDMYRGHATTLEGLASLNERLEAHGADVTCKLYDSHHYQFIPQMLIEYLKQTYPPEK